MSEDSLLQQVTAAAEERQLSQKESVKFRKQSSEVMNTKLCRIVRPNALPAVGPGILRSLFLLRVLSFKSNDLCLD